MYKRQVPYDSGVSGLPSGFIFVANPTIPTPFAVSAVPILIFPVFVFSILLPFTPTAPLPPSVSMRPVSYTHLDVYKRQPVLT